MKYALKKILLIILILKIYLISNAQFVISGKITDVDNEPVPFANVYMKGLNIGSITNIDGYYKIYSSVLGDSLSVSFIGFLNSSKVLLNKPDQVLNFQLEKNSFNLQEVVIIAGENPGDIIIKKVIKHKDENRKSSIENYQYEKYSKVEFDIFDFKDKFTERKMFEPFKFIFDYIDTTENSPYLPVFFSETLSDVYFSKEPKIRKEVIKATKASGIKNESFQQFLNSIQQEINLYDNWPLIFGKSFISPISDVGLNYYKYYLVDSVDIDGIKCYKLDFIPINKGSLTFNGEMWISDSSFALKKVNISASEHVNLNFVEKIYIQQEYNLIDGKAWMLTKDKIASNFKPIGKMTGVIGRKTISNQKIKFDVPIEKFNTKSDIEVVENVFIESDTFWQKNRHEELSKSESSIYEMVDSLKNNKRFKTYVEIIKTISSGYKVVGPIELGPILSLISYNKVEGIRLSYGMRTSNSFSKSVLLGGHIAYGFKDKNVKGGVNGLWLIKKNPRMIIGFNYFNDLDLSISNDGTSKENLLNGLVRLNIPRKLTHLHQGIIYYEKETPVGFSSRITIQHRNINPYEIPNYWDFKYRTSDNDGYRDVIITSFNTTEAIVRFRFAHQEKFLSGEFERISLGSKKPIIELTYTGGVRGIIKGGFNYHRVDLHFYSKILVNPIGNTHLDFYYGKMFGQLPYLLLYIPKGNETYFYNNNSFNMMNEYEFSSDHYGSIFIRHYFEGFFFNKIPWVRKLKLREVLTIKAVMGGMSSRNMYANSLNNFIVPNRIPYIEIGTGIENILRVFRVDFIWRVTYRNNPYVGNFGIRAGMSISF